MYYAELNVPKNHVYLFKPQMAIMREIVVYFPKLFSTEITVP